MLKVTGVIRCIYGFSVYMIFQTSSLAFNRTFYRRHLWRLTQNLLLAILKFRFSAFKIKCILCLPVCVDIDDCHDNPCYPGGVCLDRVNGFLCRCLGNWTGPLCNQGKRQWHSKGNKPQYSSFCY